jgi:mono/diheme cytochrome c family protein
MLRGEYSLGRCVLMLMLVGISADVASAQPRYESDVRPILEANCFRCHGEKHKADLDLRTRAGALKGGESGPAIVPGKANESRLLEFVAEGKMPPKGPRLSADHVAVIRRWIEAGAPGNESVEKLPTVTQHEIGPLMLLRCAVCHGLRKQEAGLDLRTRASMLRGGKTGPAIVLGKPEESLVLKKIHSGEMPPNKKLIDFGIKPMSSNEIEKLAEWIRLGAPEITIAPDVATTQPDSVVTDKDRAFWAFQPPRPVTVPPSKPRDRVRNPIDAFVLEKLRAKGLGFAEDADRLTLLRRVSFDLTGLPPEPEEVAAFLADADPCAYEKMIDRLLASPRYGERWGRYWLDLAGYADSEGKRSQDPIRPHAWRYRDYVIRAYNADKPYDRFLLEQLAGDELADYEHGPTTPEIMDNLVATGFLRMTPDGTGSDVVNFTPERIEVVADEMQVFGGAVLGLTIHCARCHSHKYDPIPQRDYFRLLDVFKGAFDEHDWLRPTSVPGQAKGKKPTRTMTYVTDDERTRWNAEKARLQKEIDDLQKESNAKEPTIKNRIKTLEAARDTEPGIHALWDRGDPSPTYIYRRGDYLQPTKLVGPGVLSVLTDGKTPFDVAPPWPGAHSTGRRLALAKWLVQPDHPLTSRVMVNRIWKHHFGAGIVATLDNFGNTGARPTHPELLDWLAREFIARGWSMKAMHRLMMTSTTYRQASMTTPQLEKLDPDNRWLSHMPLKRMEAEAVYDTLLLVAGKLDEHRHGPPDAVTVRGDGLVTAVGYRRSIYVRQRRSQIPTLLETFDLPQMNPNCVARSDSTVATQALFLTNNALVHELADAFAERVRKSAGDDIGRQIDTAYRIALSRSPTAEERALGALALTQLTEQWESDLARQGRSDRIAAARRALGSYCHTLVNSAAFVYVD